MDYHEQDQLHLDSKLHVHGWVSKKHSVCVTFLSLRVNYVIRVSTIILLLLCSQCNFTLANVTMTAAAVIRIPQT